MKKGWGSVNHPWTTCSSSSVVVEVVVLGGGGSVRFVVVYTCVLKERARARFWSIVGSIEGNETACGHDIVMFSLSYLCKGSSFGTREVVKADWSQILVLRLYASDEEQRAQGARPRGFDKNVDTCRSARIPHHYDALAFAGRGPNNF